jgi:HSP20 family molecular chaperone IbpA
MPTIVRKSVSRTAGGRREVFHAVSWLVSSGAWNPPTDAYETESAYVVRVEVAGVQEQDFEVAFEKNILLVSGVRPDAPDRRAYHQMEIRTGKFAAAVAVPFPVDVDSATATYTDGFLTVVLPKYNPNPIKVE